MRRIRLLFILAAVLGVLAGFAGNVTPAHAAPNGYMTCHINLLDEDYAIGDRPFECYY